MVPPMVEFRTTGGGMVISTLTFTPVGKVVNLCADSGNEATANSQQYV